VTQERHNWLVDGSHTGNVYGSVRIGGSSMAAREATEMGLIGPVALITKATDRTCAGGIARVDIDHTHPCTLRLVADKRSELPKRPGMAHPSLLASNRDSFSNPFQVFECECLTLTGGLLHQRLADAVIHILLKAVFAPRVLAQPPAPPAGVCQLQAAAMLESPIANVPDIRSAVRFAVRVGSKVDDAHIDS
jgi:hypothetical protein